MDTFSHWAQDEFGTVALGDERRTRRAVKIAEKMARLPWGALAVQMGDWATQRGAYRLLDNQAVSHANLSEPHWHRTRQQAGTAGQVVLLVQDMTDLDYTAHSATEGLGPIDGSALRGLWVHNTLAVLPEGPRVLGLAYQQVWGRAEEPFTTETKAQRRKRPDRESLRWSWAVETIGKPPAGVRWVHVADRAADIFEFFAQVLEQGADFCIRMVQERRLADWTQEVPKHLREQVRQLPAQGSRTLEVPAQPGRPKRQAHLAVSWQAVTIRKPRNTPGDEKLLTVWVVRTWEPEPPPDVPPIEWLLMTSVPVLTLADALERIAWYTCRWIVEEYHRCLKTGCGIEKSQLRHGQRLMRLLAFLSILAVRLLQLRDLSRTTPHLLALKVVDPLLVQIIALRLPQSPSEITLAQFWQAVAEMGGFPARTSDGPPGWLRLWRGWLHLLKLAEGVRLAQYLPPIEDVGNP